MSNLIRPKADGSPCTLHDYVGTQATEDASFELFGGIHADEGNVFLFGQLDVAYGANGASLVALANEARLLNAVEAKNVTGLPTNRQHTLCKSAGPVDRPTCKSLRVPDRQAPFCTWVHCREACFPFSN